MPAMTTAITRFEDFRALHHGPRPLFLPTAWDHASAAALVERGFAAIGTTSPGMAVAAGKRGAAARGETVRLARGLARLPALVTVDIGNGFSDRTQEVAALAAAVADAGAVGVTIGDGRAGGSLASTERQCELIAAVRAAVPHLFLNARTDTYRTAGTGATGRAQSPWQASLSAALERGRAYTAAGADGLCVPGLADDEAISTLVANIEAPLNILFIPGRHTLDHLAALGVRRASCGSLLLRAALHSATSLATSLSQGNPAPTTPNHLSFFPPE